MPTVMVGGAKVRVNWLEYYFAILPKGSPVEVTVRPVKTHLPWPNTFRSFCGTFRFSWNYDGIIGEFESGGKKIHIYGDMERNRVKVRRLKDMSRLPGCQGEGI